ncbi:Nucleic acid-binding [Abeliophyllum distichum]|uniref:Nucleic acid-binding n=1 Tax=Abeliophyllum distichum TaxID=126358 RepID=A0ABD1SXD3_9LAMI
MHTITQKNKVHATIYDANIPAYEDKLLLGKTYLISNAVVKLTKPQYQASMGEIQWTISGRTRVQEIDEDHSALISSAYNFVPFNRLEPYMDSNSDTSIIGVPIDIKPKRLVQTRFETQTYIQDIVLIDMSARVYVELEDSTGSLSGTMIGETSETLLECTAKELMDSGSQVLEKIRITVEEDQFFYIRGM